MNRRAEYVVIDPEVRQALEAGAPVVALESTIISHGMPYPRNVETARQVEEEVRSTGAIPATVAILQGRFHIGLDSEALEHLGSSDDVRKASRRDLALSRPGIQRQRQQHLEQRKINQRTAHSSQTFQY